MSIWVTVGKTVLSLLAGLAFVERRENVILIGPSGTGKTHLACAILAEVIRAGYTGLFLSVSAALRLIRDTYSPRAQRSESEAFALLTAPDLLVLDEVGLVGVVPQVRDAVRAEVGVGRNGRRRGAGGEHGGGLAERVEEQPVPLGDDLVVAAGPGPTVARLGESGPRDVDVVGADELAAVVEDTLALAQEPAWLLLDEALGARALLGIADGFIVTGDSISMLVEVAKLHKPLAIYPLPYAWLHKLDKGRRTGARWLYQQGDESQADGLRRGLLKVGGALHVLPRTRDFTAVHDLLIERGLAVPAGEPLRPSSGDVPNDLPAVVERVRALVGR